MKTIKEMPKHSRPREKLREKGASALSDEELVTAILGKEKRGREPFLSPETNKWH